MPLDFARNGSFFAYRKLHQHTDRWDRWVEEATGELMAGWDIADRDAARELLLAKMAGRWRDGVPLMHAPTLAAWDRFNRDHPPGSASRAARLTDFSYAEDIDGTKCPVTAHIRRANTRDMLDPWMGHKKSLRLGSALNNRRRLLRRGLPYGDRNDPQGEHGIILLAHCASLTRQFEFVQQQWMNYGLDFNAGNDSCPIVGTHPAGSRFVIPAEPGSGKPPFVAARLDQFVSTRGGDYFFVPSLTALRMIATGVTDPT
jgi:Dyp-type peroxidase family